MYGFCRRNCSIVQTSDARSRPAPVNSAKDYFWEQKIKDKVLSRDATPRTKYERYSRRKAETKERRQAMGDKGARRGKACCVIL